jgi:hypothetical protein
MAVSWINYRILESRVSPKPRGSTGGGKSRKGGKSWACPQTSTGGVNLENKSPQNSPPKALNLAQNSYTFWVGINLVVFNTFILELISTDPHGPICSQRPMHHRGTVLA